MSTPKPDLKVIPSERYCHLMMKYNGHSIFARMANAIRDGKDSICFYRPHNTVKAVRATDELIELFRLCGCTVEMQPCNSPDVSLYLVSDLHCLTDKR
ncbi:hypothetical protein DEEACLCL_00012 [Salmonella phage CRW-SP2]|nr:hypothetical protein DEEACLCL_00012 [Salmonella phage CRW-SP2]